MTRNYLRVHSWNVPSIFSFSFIVAVQCVFVFPITIMFIERKNFCDSGKQIQVSVWTDEMYNLQWKPWVPYREANRKIQGNHNFSHTDESVHPMFLVAIHLSNECKMKMIKITASLWWKKPPGDRVTILVSPILSLHTSEELASYHWHLKKVLQNTDKYYRNVD